MIVAGHEVQALLVIGRLAWIAGRLPAHQLAKDPRIQECATADRDAGTTRLAEHALGLGEIFHVAVADDRDALDRLDNGADAGQIHLAREPLSARSTVNDHAGKANLFKRPGKVRG